MALSIIKNNDNAIQNQLSEYENGIEIAKFQMNAHYDEAKINLDLRVEKLIESIHDSSDLLRQEIEICREKTNQEILKSEKNYNDNLKELIKKIDLKKNTEIIQSSNYLELKIDELKSNKWSFVENSFTFDNSIVGFNLQSSVDYFKIKNLQSLKDKQKLIVNLISKFNLPILDSRVIIPSRTCFIKCYLSTENRVFFELFDQSGLSNKIIVLKQKSTLIPNLVCNSKYFIFTFDYVFASNNVQHFISIFDCNLNKIKSISSNYSIESIYINEKSIICTYLNANPHHIYNVFDFNLTHITSFGQCYNEFSKFYVRRNDIPFSEKGILKYNPVLFGFTDDNIYFHNKVCIVIMCKKTGDIVKQFKKTCQSSELMVDRNSDILEFNLLGNYIKLYNIEKNICITGNYFGSYSEILNIENGYFVFINFEKNNLIIV